MIEATTTAMLQNVAILLALAVLYDLLSPWRGVAEDRQRQFGVGLLVAGAAVTAMVSAIEAEPGVIFDARSAVLAISGLFFGGLTTGVAMAGAITYRLYIGGPGTMTGVYVIGASGAIGLLWRRLRPRPLETLRLPELLAFGVTVHIAALLLMLTLPEGRGPVVMRGIALPFLLVLPLGTAVLGGLLTRRLRMERERRERAEELDLHAAALEAAANPIVITDRSGAIEWVNPAFTRLTGYTLDEAVGHNPRDLVSSGVHDTAFFQDLWSTILAGRVWRGEVTNRRKDGTLYHEEQAITPVRNADGEITHFVAVKQDLTERRELEERFLQAQKMESVGRLAGGVSHDFNNLLTVINGTLDLVLSDLPPVHELRDDLEEVRRAGDRGSALTRQLLLFSRREVLQPVPVGLNALLRDMLRMLDRLLGSRVQVVTELCNPEPIVEVDPGRMEQALVNLAVNARDAMPDGGTLTFRTRVIELAADDPALEDTMPGGRYLRLAVEDTGTGIDPELLPKVFEPFFTTKPQGKGTGLGLPTVYGIVRQSGGSVRIESEPGVGTTAIVHLPLLEEGTPA